MSDPIARLEVVERAQLGLQLIGRRRLDDLHRMLLGRLGAQGDELLRVRRPPQLAEVVAVIGASVRAEHEFLARVLGPQAEVMVLKKDEPFSVGRFRVAAASAFGGAFPRTRFLFGRRRPAGLDDGPGLLLGRLEDAERRAGLLRDQPDMTGERMLIVLIAGGDRGIAAPLAVHVDPIDDDFRRRLVHERNARLRTGTAGRARSPLSGQRFGCRPRRVGLAQLVLAQIQTPSLVAAAQHDRAGILVKRKPFDRQLVRRHRAAQQLAKRLRDPCVIKRWLSRALLGVDENELAAAVRQFVAVPKPRLVGEPMRGDLVPIDPRFARIRAVGPSEQEHQR